MIDDEITMRARELFDAIRAAYLQMAANCSFEARISIAEARAVLSALVTIVGPRDQGGVGGILLDVLRERIDELHDLVDAAEQKPKRGEK
jgi:hypothetical protein